MYSGVAPSLWVLSVFEPAHAALLCLAGLFCPLPDLSAVYFPAWDAWGTRRPPAGRGPAELAPNWRRARQGKEPEEDACGLPGPLPCSLPGSPLLTFPLLSRAESSESGSTDLKVQGPTIGGPTRVTQQTAPRGSAWPTAKHSPLPFHPLPMPAFCERGWG